MTRRSCLLGVLVACSSACGGAEPRVEGMGSTVDEDATVASAISGDLAFGTRLVTTGDLNLRTGPGTSYAIRAVMPKGETVRVVRTTPTSGWYNINYDGLVGWASGSYLDVSLVPSGSRQAAIARGISVWGFSYHWAGGDWDPTSQSPGSCTGSCPDCTHSGTNGADCSGFVAKAWVVPPDNTPLTKASHPYSTYNFRYESQYWSTILRDDATTADAMVYNTDGAGHVFLVYGGDPWGTIQAIECRGCSDGCVYNNRTASSSYVAIHRDGY